MFTITIDGHFPVGATREVKVNGKPTTLTYTDPGTLTLGDTTRRITYVNHTLNDQTFVCASERGAVIVPVALGEGDDIPF